MKRSAPSIAPPARRAGGERASAASSAADFALGLRLPRWWPIAAIVLVTVVVYLPAVSARYIWDDDAFLTQNPLIHAPDGLYKFWFTKEPFDYFPLTSTDLWLEWRLWGDNPMPYHAGNILLHAAGAVLLWRVLVRLKVPGALLAGLIFAVHPVAVSSVAWITERKNTLPMVLMLGAILAYLRFDEGTKRKYLHYGVALGLFAAALLAKPSVVMLPVALLLLAFWRRGRIGLKDVLRTVPFFVLSAAAGLATMWFQYHRAMGGDAVDIGSWPTRIARAGWVAWFYLGKLLAPVGLCMVYPHWDVKGDHLLAFLPMAAMTAVLAGLFLLRGRIGRGPVTALAYFLLMLLPVLGFVSMSYMQFSFVSDHLQYAAMIGIIALAAGALAKLPLWRRLPTAAPIVAAAGLLGVLGTATFLHAAEYKDTATLWRANLRINPDAALIYSDLASNEQEPLAQRLEYCDKAIALEKSFVNPWVNRAFIHNQMGRYEDAVQDSDQAIKLSPGLAQAYVNRAVARHKLGHDDLAEQDALRAIKLDPFEPTAYWEYAEVLAAHGQANAAIEQLSKALRASPAYARAYLGRAMCYHHLKQYDRAWADIRAFRKMGGTPPAEFIEQLRQASGHSE